MDGTACDLKDGIKRICVNGECRSVGCDGFLGSSMREDKCRVCGGDGQDCLTEEGVFTDEVIILVTLMRKTSIEKKTDKRRIMLTIVIIFFSGTNYGI